MCVPGVRQSKFRHLKGNSLRRTHGIENLRNVAQNIPGESDMFCANPTFCAVPLGGSGGLIAILKVRLDTVAMAWLLLHHLELTVINN